MNEEQTKAEMRSVFSKAMKPSPAFRFHVLHPIEGGSKTLTVPNTSFYFVWTAKEVCKAAGRGAIYLWAIDDLAEDDGKMGCCNSDGDSDSGNYW